MFTSGLLPGARYQESRLCRAYAYATVACVALGIATTMTMALTRLRGETFSFVTVMLPMMAGFMALFIFYSVALLAWVWRLCSVARTDEILDDEIDVKMDVLMKNMKRVFASHLYVSLLAVAAVLLTLHMGKGSTMSLMQASLPLIFLGFLHLLMALAFKEPELSPARTAGIGLALLAHIGTLVIKEDYNAKLAWSTVFTPSWVTYAAVVSACFTTAVFGTPRTSERTVLTKDAQIDSSDAQGMVFWALCFSCGQVLLACRLDEIWHAPWYSILIPTLIGWVVFTVVVGRLFANDMSKTLSMLCFPDAGPNPERRL